MAEQGIGLDWAKRRMGMHRDGTAMMSMSDGIGAGL